MNVDWQNAAVLVVVVAACAYLGRAAWRTIARRKAAACGGCGTCPSNANQQKLQVVGLSPLAPSADATTPEASSPNGSPRVS
jgi:hypothetical protein